MGNTELATRLAALPVLNNDGLLVGMVYTGAPSDKADQCVRVDLIRRYLDSLKLSG